MRYGLKYITLITDNTMLCFALAFSPLSVRMERPTPTGSAEAAPRGTTEGTTSCTALQHLGSATPQPGQKRTPRATEAPPEMGCGIIYLVAFGVCSLLPTSSDIFL